MQQVTIFNIPTRRLPFVENQNFKNKEFGMKGSVAQW
jgi:hypothetical protein